MTTDTETKQTEEKKVEEVKEDVRKEEEAAKDTEEKSDDKAEKDDKEKKDQKAEKPKKEVAPPKPAVHKADYQADTVYLYQFMRTPVLPSLSPYCLKVETWLRLAGLKYEVSPSTLARPPQWRFPRPAHCKYFPVTSLSVTPVI